VVDQLPVAAASSSGHGGRLSSDPVEPLEPLEPELALGLAVGVDDCASAALAPTVPTIRAAAVRPRPSIALRILGVMLVTSSRISVQRQDTNAIRGWDERGLRIGGASATPSASGGLTVPELRGTTAASGE
jgi:hypothetical protein